MSTFNVHGGHNFKVQGASGCFSETIEDRNVKNKVIALLRAEGHTVYDCTDENGTTQSKNLANIVALQNQHTVDLDISIHFNASNGQGHGTEVLQYSSKTQSYSERIVNNIAALGFKNRGVKDGKKLYVLRKSKNKAILIECCFCDNAEDAKIYNADKMASAIVSGILNKNVEISDSSPAPTTNTTSAQLYRVRKSWGDAKSQLGAYKSLDNAKKECPNGYTVYDSNGNAVYSPSSSISNTNSQLYRVRKSWNDAKSQTGAYKSLDNAKAECGDGYTVYDSNGNAVYTKSSTTNPVSDQLYRVRKSWSDAKSQLGAYKNLDNAKAECPNGYTVYDSNGNAVYFNIQDNKPNNTTIDNSSVPTKAPEAVDVNNLKDMTHDAFIQYIGNLAKTDKNGILPSITIAQAILESSWGTSELSTKANNLFGMKKSLSGNNWGSEWDGKIYAVKTKEEENGNIIEILADFRSYNSIAESVKDHNKYLANAKNGNKLRYNGMIGAKDYKTAAQLLVSGGYATDSKYADKLCNIIEKYNLDTFDYVGDSTELENENKELKGTLNIILELLEKIIQIIKSALKK